MAFVPTEYRFRSKLPPEEAWNELKRQVEKENEDLTRWREDPAENLFWRAKWELEKEEETLFLRYTYSRMSRGRGAGKTLALRSQRSDEEADRLDRANPLVQNLQGDPFRGRFEPDGNGGSLLRGKFAPAIGSQMLHLVMVALGVSLIALAGGIAKLAGVFMAGFYLYSLLKLPATAPGRPLNREVLRLLTQVYGEPETGEAAD